MRRCGSLGFGVVTGDRAKRLYSLGIRPRRLFFMHLPKTAGMALRLFLGNQYPVDRIMPANDWRELLSVEIADLDRYSLFQGHFSCGLMDLLPPDIAPIVFLREPVARTVSHLKHMRRDPSFSPVGYRLAAGRSLDELVRDEYVMKLCCDVQSSLLCNYISGQSILAGLRRDQMAGLEPNPDAFPVPPDLAVAQESLERFRFVGLVEDFQDAVLQLSLELGLHPPQPPPDRRTRRLRDDRPDPRFERVCLRSGGGRRSSLDRTARPDDPRIAARSRVRFRDRDACADRRARRSHRSHRRCRIAAPPRRHG